MLISLRSAIRRHRARLALIGAVLMLAGCVVAAHGAMGDAHMGKAMAMCLAVTETAAFAVGAGLALVRALACHRRLPLSILPSTGPWDVAAPLRVTSAARASPALLQVFRR